MPLFALPFPAIDPVAVSLGPFAIRWYALAYIVGLLIGWRYCLGLAGRPPHRVARHDGDALPGSTAPRPAPTRTATVSRTAAPDGALPHSEAPRRHALDASTATE